MKIDNKTYSFFILTVLLSFTAEAFRFEPMQAEFTPEGQGTTKIFRVENEAKESVAIKIEAFTREIDDKGKETQVPSKDFKIFPDQISLAASDSRAIRVMYIGPKSLEKETAYRIVASQLPVSFKEEKKKTGIKFLFQFLASVYVTSDKFYPKIEVESISRVDKDNIKLKIINKGQKHTLLKHVKIEIKDTSGKSLIMSNEVLQNWDSENILSGTRRTFIIKTPLNYDVDKYRAKVEINEEI